MGVACGPEECAYETHSELNAARSSGEAGLDVDCSNIGLSWSPLGWMPRPNASSATGRSVTVLRSMLSLDVWINKNVSKVLGLVVETIRAELQQRGLAVREEWQDRFWLRLSSIEQARSLVAQLRHWKPEASTTAGA